MKEKKDLFSEFKNIPAVMIWGALITLSIAINVAQQTTAQNIMYYVLDILGTALLLFIIAVIGIVAAEYSTNWTNSKPMKILSFVFIMCLVWFAFNHFLGGADPIEYHPENMKLEQIEHPLVSAMGYNGKHEVFVVQLKSTGERVAYYGITRQIYNEMMSDLAPISFFWRHIRNDYVHEVLN